jgi:hypothetical protein
MSEFDSKSKSSSAEAVQLEKNDSSSSSQSEFEDNRQEQSRLKKLTQLAAKGAASPPPIQTKSKSHLRYASHGTARPMFQASQYPVKVVQRVDKAEVAKKVGMAGASTVAAPLVDVGKAISRSKGGKTGAAVLGKDYARAATFDYSLAYGHKGARIGQLGQGVSSLAGTTMKWAGSLAALTGIIGIWAPPALTVTTAASSVASVAGLTKLAASGLQESYTAERANMIWSQMKVGSAEAGGMVSKEDAKAYLYTLDENKFTKKEFAKTAVGAAVSIGVGMAAEASGTSAGGSSDHDAQAYFEETVGLSEADTNWGEALAGGTLGAFTEGVNEEMESGMNPEFVPRTGIDTSNDVPFADLPLPPKHAPWSKKKAHLMNPLNLLFRGFKKMANLAAAASNSMKSDKDHKGTIGATMKPTEVNDNQEGAGHAIKRTVGNAFAAEGQKIDASGETIAHSEEGRGRTMARTGAAGLTGLSTGATGAVGGAIVGAGQGAKKAASSTYKALSAKAEENIEGDGMGKKALRGAAKLGAGVASVVAGAVGAVGGLLAGAVKGAASAAKSGYEFVQEAGSDIDPKSWLDNLFSWLEEKENQLENWIKELNGE